MGIDIQCMSAIVCQIVTFFPQYCKVYYEGLYILGPRSGRIRRWGPVGVGVSNLVWTTPLNKKKVWYHGLGHCVNVTDYAFVWKNVDFGTLDVESIGML